MYINIMHKVLDTCPFENIQKPLRARVLLSQDRSTWRDYHQRLKICCWVHYQPFLKISSTSFHNKLCKVGQIQNHYFCDGKKYCVIFIIQETHLLFIFLCSS